jgi:hypothetical protein
MQALSKVVVAVGVAGRLHRWPERRSPDRWVGPGTDGTVVTDGIESALEQARAVAG